MPGLKVMYCTKDDILSRISEAELAQLTSENGTVVDDGIVSSAIAAADSEIDGYAAKYHSTPLAAPIPTRVTNLSATIAVYNLYCKRPALAMPETIRNTYKDAIAFLTLLANSKVSLGVDPPPAAPSVPSARAKSNDRMFTDESLRGM